VSFLSFLSCPTISQHARYRLLASVLRKEFSSSRDGQNLFSPDSDYVCQRDCQAITLDRTTTCFLRYIPVVLLAGLMACNQPAGNKRFTSLDSTQTGIGFVNRLPENDKLSIIDYLYYYNGAGVGAGDVNNDGLTDLFFASNRGKNKLYLNKGNWQFEDISAKAGIEGFADWKTGVSLADVNGDGLLDIYVCAVGNYKGLEGSNELYINNGDLTFTEKAADYGIDFTGFSTQAAFFDYDKDGDLDMYLLNHAVHTARSYNRVLARLLKNNEAGDYLFKNMLVENTRSGKKDLRFQDVSAQAGIYQAAMGYGLGVVVADFNQDGWEDVYVSNDFHEDDYYYLNNHDGTFKEELRKHFGHLSRFSMGCDAADVNNDGFTDLMTLDMYPNDETVEKSSMGEDPLDIYLFKLEFGFHNQYSRNCLQLNQGGMHFSEVGSLAGVAATDWSWSTLMADYDNDGLKDIFVTNGIPKRPNDLDYIKFASNDSMRYAMELSKSLDKKALALMPDGRWHNYLFKGTPSLHFEDKSKEWGMEMPNCSNGAVYADLDNDGDLDLVTNNLNEAASLYRNTTIDKAKENQPHYLKIKLEGDKPNAFGLGTTVTLRYKGQLQQQQLMPVRGFLSSVEPVLLFGLGSQTQVDTLEITWPDLRTEIKTGIKADQVLVLRQADARPSGTSPALITPVFEDVSAQLNFIADSQYVHQENKYFDFNRETLMPFKVSTEGPALAIGDVNGDGLEDFYAGGAKWQAGKLFLQQKDGQFRFSPQPVFQQDSVYEDVDALFLDVDNDKDADLYVVSGGNEFFGKMSELFDRLYLNDGKGGFTRATSQLPPMFDNKSCVRAADFDKDGDPDLFVGGRVVGFQYGKAPDSYLLVNDGKGHFSDQTDKLAPQLRKAGMVTNAAWADTDKDGDLDLMLAGDWMAPMLLENQQSKFKSLPLQFTDKTGKPLGMKGFWQGMATADLDKDGDPDFVLGNLGTNTKFRKHPTDVLKMYVKDLDGNETTEQILACGSAEKLYPIASKDELGKQLPGIIQKRFPNYKSFAGKTVAEVFTKQELKGALELEVNRFESVYLENLGGGKYKVHFLPTEAQVSKVFAVYIDDIDRDGQQDVLLGGNFYGASMYQGRYDASYGVWLKNKGKGQFRTVPDWESGLWLQGEIRNILPIKRGEQVLYLIARNNQPLQALVWTKRPL
jgi:hypothetical protein